MYMRVCVRESVYMCFLFAYIDICGMVCACVIVSASAFCSRMHLQRVRDTALVKHSCSKLSEAFLFCWFPSTHGRQNERAGAKKKYDSGEISSADTPYKRCVRQRNASLWA